MRFILRTMMVLCTVLSFAVQVQAAERRYLVLPFAVNGPSSLSYLSDAIPSMLNSRLYVKGKTQPVSADGKVSAAADANAAKAAMGKSNADYVIWGNVTATGDNATVDMNLVGKDGSAWKRSSDTNLAGLIGTLQRMADGINAEVFGMAGSAPAQGQPTAPMNPAFVSNDPNVQRQTYLNPQFRYQGNDTARMRSQALPFAAIGMDIGDVNGDGKNEIVLLAEHKLYVYQWGTDQMKLIGEHQLPMTDDALSVRVMPAVQGRAGDIIVNMIDREQSMPRAHVLNFSGNQFTVIGQRLPYYLNVVKLAPDYRAVMVGQKGDSQNIFASSGVFEMMKNGNQIVPGRKVDLPKEANVLNFAWLPSSKGDGDKIVVLSKDEKIAVYSEKLSRIYLTDEKFSGSSVGIENQMNMPGLGKDTVSIPRMYHMPLRMVPVDLEGRGDFTLLVNKPISVAAQFFDRYRFYPEGEIHDLFWDGVGLSLLWKTRRIKGSVVDFNTADISGDGQSLVVCINTHPGSLGFSQRRTVVLNYPLDLSQTDPNTPVYAD